mgnify:CR=1 FL=1
MNESTNHIILKPTTVPDLDRLFDIQLDQQGNYLAAFTSKDYDDKEAYLAKFRRLLLNPTVNNQTIWLDGQIIGSVAKFMRDGEAEITYWIDRAWWNRGITSAALKLFLDLEKTRPVSARVAADNQGSIRVLERNGFRKIGTDRGYAFARQAELEEIIFRLE